MPDGRSVRRGDALAATIEWVCERPCPSGGYLAFVRFDMDYGKGSLYRDWYSKLYRKVQETRHHQRYRFTNAHLPVNGVFPPDRWQPFTVIRDRFTVAVPSHIAPGVYRVSVKLVLQTQYPNHTIRDFLSDRDSVTGEVITEVIVE